MYLYRWIGFILLTIDALLGVLTLGFVPGTMVDVYWDYLASCGAIDEEEENDTYF